MFDLNFSSGRIESYEQKKADLKRLYKTQNSDKEF